MMCNEGGEGGREAGEGGVPLDLQSSSLSSNAIMRTVPSKEQDKSIIPSADQEKSAVAAEGGREGGREGGEGGKRSSTKV